MSQIKLRALSCFYLSQGILSQQQGGKLRWGGALWGGLSSQSSCTGKRTGVEVLGAHRHVSEHGSPCVVPALEGGNKGSLSKLASETRLAGKL